MSNNISFRGWFPLKSSTVFYGVIFPTLVVYFTAVSFFGSRLIAGLLASLTFFGLMAFWLGSAVKPWTKQKNEDDVFKPMWGDGEHIFAEQWVLTLSIRRPSEIVIPTKGSMYNLYQYLEDYTQRVKAAVEYFSEGKYLIGCNGRMHKLGDEAAAKLSGCPQISAAIDFDELPRAETIAHRLANDTPKDILQKAKNCVLLDVHAHGTIQKDDGAKFDCMPRFASRDGAIIVESC